MAELIEREDWETALEVCRSHPEQIMAGLDRQTGGTVLHRLCTKPHAPLYLFEAVLNAYPEAVRIQDTAYQATPLHVLSWTAQRSTAIFSLLLSHTNQDDLERLNRYGGTVLHSACGSQASLDVIKLIVQKNPGIVLARTHDSNHTALTALWQSHLQSIPGHMQVATILKGETVTSDHFDRFWEKVTFLARVAYRQSCPSCTDDSITNGMYELHGLFQLRAPINAIKVAIRRHPEWAQVPDSDGNYPLHVVVIRRPFRVKDKDIIDMLLKAYPDAAGKKNKAGDTAIFLAIRDRIDWNDGLKCIVQADTDTLASSDSQTGLYPFLLAASLGGRVAVNTTYELLCERPDLVATATTNGD
jgi:hypothetical protein